MTIFRRGLERESLKRWDMDVLASGLFSEKRIASNVSFSGERMHAFGGTVAEASCGVWWIGGTALGNCDGFFLSSVGRYLILYWIVMKNNSSELTRLD